MATHSCSGQGSHSVGEISEVIPKRQEVTSQGKIRGRNLGRGNDKCKAPEARRNSKRAVVAGPDEREGGHRGGQDSGHKGSYWPGSKFGFHSLWVVFKFSRRVKEL